MTSQYPKVEHRGARSDSAPCCATLVQHLFLAGRILETDDSLETRVAKLESRIKFFGEILAFTVGVVLGGITYRFAHDTLGAPRLIADIAAIAVWGVSGSAIWKLFYDKR